jgi:hypothetical protein
MRTYLKLTFAAIVFLFSITLGFGQAAPTLDSLKWMSGCWEMNVKEKNLLISENWMKPAGRSMMGMGRTVKNGMTVDFEFLRIIEEAGGVFYVAKPKANQEETRFKLTKVTANEAIFENPEHDFPQRVMYRADKANLFARIEGMMQGKLKGIDFPMVKVKCD